MAARTHFTKGHLGNVEAGRRAAKPEVAGAYEQVLGVQIQSPTVELGQLLDGLAAAPRPTRAGMADVSALEAATNMLTALDLDQGGGLACEMGKGQLRWAVGLLGASMSDPVRKRLSAVIAMLANRTGFSMFDAGETTSAGRLSRLALKASEGANDADLSAHILADTASQMIHLGHPAGALRMIDIPDGGLAPVTRFVLCGMRAQAYGTVGDASATWRHVRLAERAYDAIDLSEIPACVRPFADGHAAHADRDVGNALFALSSKGSGKARREARERLNAAIRSFGHGRTRAVVRSQVRLALLLDAEGEQEQARAVARKAFTAGCRLRSARVAADLAKLRRLLAA